MKEKQILKQIQETGLHRTIKELPGAETCENCYYWAEGSPFGKCRKRAPVLVISADGEQYADYPSTVKSHWCGEFKNKEGYFKR